MEKEEEVISEKPPQIIQDVPSDPQRPVFTIPTKKGPKTTTNPYLSRPARRQVPKGGPIQHEFTHHSSDYNIWYHKKLGDRFEKEDRVKASTRCNVSNDSGYTRADITGKDSFICIYYARGHCTNGAQCNYYHRPPTVEDELKLDIAHDVFGRERHRTYRDDMGGVGSFARENRVLYIQGFQRSNLSEDSLARHFAEWGEMEYVKIMWDKGVAFVKFKLRSSAEFAKEAMTDQSLDGNEVLNIRWAAEDPDPDQRKKDEAEQYLQIAKKLAEKREREDPLYSYQNGSQDGTSYDYFPSENLGATEYPNTDQQYQSSYSSSSVSEWLDQKNLGQYKNDFLSGGYFDLPSLRNLDEIGLDALGVTDENHRSLLMAAIAEIPPEPQQPIQQTNIHYFGGQQYLFTNPEYTGDQYSEQQYENSYDSNYSNFQEKTEAEHEAHSSPKQLLKSPGVSHPAKKAKLVSPVKPLVAYQDDE